MKGTHFIFSLTLIVLVSGSAFPRTPNIDAYTQCMTRTKHNRMDCQAGCGMIVQQCYDEGVADINNQIIKLNENINKENGAECANITANYLSEASRMEVDIEKQTANLVGWVGSELTLNFARQRLENVLLIQRLCKR